MSFATQMRPRDISLTILAFPCRDLIAGQSLERNRNWMAVDMPGAL